MTVLILHGIQGKAGNHWQQWLHDSLIKKGYTVLMPNLPKADHPNRGEWLKTLQEILKSVDSKDLVIVGHSLGVVTALDYIEQANGEIKALISISGFSSDYGNELNSYFLKNKLINLFKVKEHLEKAFIIYSDNDPYVPQDKLNELVKPLDAILKIIHSGGHLNTNAGFITFPYLLEIFDSL
jgi:uncharacterized protein